MSFSATRLFVSRLLTTRWVPLVVCRQRGQQQALERDQDDILEMSYEQYTARFWQLKNVQGGGPASRNGKSADGATGKENAEAATTVPGMRTAAGNAPAAAGAAAAAPDI